MNRLKSYFFFSLIIILSVSCSTTTTNKKSYVQIKTTLGNITLLLYDETPIHRDNFIKLVKAHVYDGITFHRVIKDFMIQSGDPETRTGYVKSDNDTLGTYTIPAEFNLSLFHKKGALAAAREGNEVNPEMRSSGTQFYIVQGVKYSDIMLDQAEERIRNNKKQALFIQLIKQMSDSNAIAAVKLSPAEIGEKASLRMFEEMAAEPEYKIPEIERNVYKTIGGVPRLDGTYTVFGEVVDGLDVVDRIVDVKTDEKDKPLTDIRIIRAEVILK